MRSALTWNTLTWGNGVLVLLPVYSCSDNGARGWWGHAEDSPSEEGHLRGHNEADP